MARHSDTIVAPITAVGGSVALVRISGPRAWQVAAKLFEDFPTEPKPMRLYYGSLCTGDDGLLSLFETGYTGELSAEISSHGSPAAVAALVDSCLNHGARMAEPGEFSLRAFLNGRLDLTQAEGVRESVEAQTAAQMRRANCLRAGGLSERYRSVADALTTALVPIEANTDFSEEVGDLDEATVTAKLESAVVEMEILLEAAHRGARYESAPLIAIVGLPNAGKSSLLNALLGSSRAIVTEIAGTTRDTVEEMADLSGVPCRLVDTAGMRQSDDPVESIGVERARDALQRADLVLYVFDSAAGWSAADYALSDKTDRPTLLVANKSDLASAGRGVPVSCLNMSGLGEIQGWVVEQIGELPEFAPTARHIEPICVALGATHSARRTILDPNLPYDLAVVDLRLALRKIGEITGKTATEDMLEKLFSTFCIGK